MKVIKLNNNNNPYYNLASEEYLLKYEKDLLNEDLFIIWQNDNAIIIGNNQNLFSEVNLLYANENNVNILRRVSGGGAVYHDINNINFTFIKRNKKKEFNFKECLSEILNYFHSLKLNAYFSGRNDILVDEKKVVGNAVYFYQNDYMLHGCILYDVNIEVLVNCLNVDKTKLISKGIESVKSRVTNLKEYLKLDTNDFVNDILKYFEKKYNTQTINLNLLDNSKVKELVETKFANYEYTYNKTYDFNYSNKIKIESGLISVNLELELTNIKNIEFYTDDLFAFNFKNIKEIFINQKYDINNIKSILNKIDLKKYHPTITINNLIDLLFKNN